MELNSPHYEDLDLEILQDDMPPPSRGRTAVIAAAVAVAALAVLSGRISGATSAPPGQGESPAAVASLSAYDQQVSATNLWQGLYDSQVPTAARHC